MSNKWIYFFVLGLPVDPPPKTADIRQAIEQKTQEWTADLQNPQKRETAEKWLTEIPAMRTALLLPANRMELAWEANQFRKEKLAELRQELTVDWYDREVADSDIAALIDRYPYSIHESDIHLLCKELAIHVAEDTSILSSKSISSNLIGEAFQSSVAIGEQLSERPVSENRGTNPSIKTGDSNLSKEKQLKKFKSVLSTHYSQVKELSPAIIQHFLSEYPSLTHDDIQEQFQRMKQELESSQSRRWQTDNDSLSSSGTTSNPSNKTTDNSPSFKYWLIIGGIIVSIFSLLFFFLPWWGAGLGTLGIIGILKILLDSSNGSGGSIGGPGSGGSIGGSNFSGPRIGE